MNTKKEVVEKFEKLILDDIKFGIVTALDWYKSLNLTKLAKMIGKPESTTIRYLKQLLEDDIIAVDVDKTAKKWGKYYKLSDAVKTLYEEKTKSYEEREKVLLEIQKQLDEISDEELNQLVIEDILSRKDLDKTIMMTRQYLAVIQNLQSIIVNDLIINYEDLTKLIEEKGSNYLRDNLILGPSDFSIFNEVIRVSKVRHLIKMYEVIRQFLLNIDKLRKEIEGEMDAEGVPEEDRITQVLHLFSGSTEFRAGFKDEER